jgi:hypothetical protein
MANGGPCGSPQGEDLVQQVAHELGITDEDNWDLMDELREAVEKDGPQGDEAYDQRGFGMNALEEFGPNGPDGEPDDPRAYE